jgi:chromate reductase
MALALAKMAAPALRFDLIEIGDLPLYNEDLEASGTPQTWTTFRAQIRSCQAVGFVTPEYNRSVPAALQNALDAVMISPRSRPSRGGRTHRICARCCDWAMR